jgi:hypothetical protein
VPNTANGQRDFVAYVVSSVDGQQTSVSVPVNVGAVPSPTPVVAGSTAPAPRPLTATTVSTCHGDGTVAPADSSAAAFRSLPLTANLTAPVLQLANPSSGNVLLTGDLFIDGVAYDPGATDGADIDRVDVFMDSRDSGGLLLGSGEPGDTGASSARAFHIKIDVPHNANGRHDVFV